MIAEILFHVLCSRIHLPGIRNLTVSGETLFSQRRTPRHIDASFLWWSAVEGDAGVFGRRVRGTPRGLARPGPGPQ